MALLDLTLRIFACRAGFARDKTWLSRKAAKIAKKRERRKPPSSTSRSGHYPTIGRFAEDGMSE